MWHSLEGYCPSMLSCVAVMQAHAVKPPMYDQEEQEQCPDEALFKTRMCVYFQQGRCQRGSACTFAHDPAELQAYNPARRYAQQVFIKCAVVASQTCGCTSCWHVKWQR